MNTLKDFYKNIKSPSTIFQYATGTAIGAAMLLIIPLTAKLFLEGFEWSGADFFAAWILFFSAGLTYRLVAGRIKNNMYRAAVGLAVFTGLFLIWSNLAVGLIDSEDNPANLMYLGVIAIGFLGAIISKFQPKKMAFVLFSLAFAHAVITGAALIARLDLAPESSAVEILGVNGFFAVLWIGSGLLFLNASIDQKTLVNKTD